MRILKALIVIPILISLTACGNGTQWWSSEANDQQVYTNEDAAADYNAGGFNDEAWKEANREEAPVEDF